MGKRRSTTRSVFDRYFFHRTRYKTKACFPVKKTDCYSCLTRYRVLKAILYAHGLPHKGFHHFPTMAAGVVSQKRLSRFRRMPFSQDILRKSNEFSLSGGITTLKISLMTHSVIRILLKKWVKKRGLKIILDPQQVD